MRNLRTNHKRGISQEINKTHKYSPLNSREFLNDKIGWLAMSSQHSRSTTITNKHQKSKTYKNKKDKVSPPKVGKLVWNPSLIPYSPQHALKYYSHYLDSNEKAQILQFKNIYYIGQNKTGQIAQNQPGQELFFRYQIGGHVAYRFQIKQKINKGSFGEVLKVFDHKTKELQALKIVKRAPELIKQTFVEISLLTKIKEKDPEDFSGIVRIKDFTLFRDHICILFELLDSNLFELMHANDFKGLNEEFIRVFSIQILNSLNFLSRMKIIHCDLKPQNIVLKVWGKSGIKLIDFGTSCFQDQQLYTYIQSRYYRAPQILFLKEYTMSIDMWSFACMIAQLYLGKPLFPGNTDIQHLIYMISILGFPPSYLYPHKPELQIIKEKGYCEKDENGEIKKQSILKFKQNTGFSLDEECLIPLQKRLQDKILFLHFLKQILKWDPRERISPSEALQHPWIMNGLPQQIKQLYTIYQTLNNMSKNYEKKTKKKSKSKSKDKEKKKKSNYTFQSFNYYISKSIIQTNPQSKSITYRESKSKSKSKQKSKSIPPKKSVQKKLIKIKK